MSVFLLLGLVYLILEFLLTYSTSFRHGGQAKAGSAAPLAHTVFCKWSIALRKRSELQLASLMHRSLLRRANVGYGGPGAAYDTCG